MFKEKRTGGWSSIPVAMAVFWISIAVISLFTNSTSPSELVRNSDSAKRLPTGRLHLVSVAPIASVAPMTGAEAGGQMCEWIPASSSGQLLALRQNATKAASHDPATAPRDSLDRPPLRMIKDPHPTYSAVAVDMKNDEVVLQDENLFQIMVYDGTTNTPASAAFSEPKRVIGGHETKVEFNCGLYIDQVNGDIYSVNNDTIRRLVIFNRSAKGDVPPTRELETPQGTNGIAVDEGAEEMFLTVQHASSVVIYRKYAQGTEKPIRMIVGNKTGLADPHGVALDTQNGWAFVANYGAFAAYEAGKERDGGGSFGGDGRILGSGKFLEPSITVYPIRADGDIPPLRTISGPKTQMNWPAHVAIDQENGFLYVANDGGDSVLVFRTTDNGNVAPTRVIKGPLTQVKNPTGVAIDTKKKELLVANMGNHRATVFPLDANGNVPPKRVIRGAPADQQALQIGNPGAVAYDSKRNEILVPN